MFAAKRLSQQIACVVFSTAILLTAFDCFGAEENPLYLQGKEAAEHGKYKQAIKLFLSAAKQGYAPAQFTLGNAYIFGKGTKRDPQKAAHWWQQAAAQNLAEAQNSLGMLLYYNYGTPQSKRFGIAWLQVAADQGDKSSADRLAEIREASSPGEEPGWDNGLERVEIDILTRDPKRYTIQLFSAKKLKSAEGLVRKHNLADKASIYRFPRSGGYWYGVMYGDYAGVTPAKKAIEKMPSAVKKSKPWVSGNNAVQKSIHAQHAALLGHTKTGK